MDQLFEDCIQMTVGFSADDGARFTLIEHRAGGGRPLHVR